MGISIALDLSSQHLALSAAFFFTLVSLYVAMGWFNKKISFSGCHVLITGGSTGIGLALAQEFTLLGASVTILARTRSKLDKAVSGLEELIQHKGLPGRAQAIAADVTDGQQVQALTCSLAKRLSCVKDSRAVYKLPCSLGDLSR